MYVIPERKIFKQFDLNPWVHSKAFKDYMDFLRECNEATRGVYTTDDVHVSQFLLEFIELLETIQKYTLDYPPQDESKQRFGNKAFRLWMERVEIHAKELLKAILPDEKKAAIDEIFPYFGDSFGNATRIDYGTGHEMNFIIFLLCLYKLKLFTKDDLKCIVTRVFCKYLRVCRFIQIRYKMEPAGSRGVNSIDDYQFVPFIWGSAQLINHGKLIPDDYLRSEVCTSYGHLSLFIEAVEFIHAHKTGPFFEHSNELYNCSNVDGWVKMNNGMIKKYEHDVLKQFPVVQHTLFGSLFSWERREDAPNEPLFRVPARPEASHEPSKKSEETPSSSSG